MLSFMEGGRVSESEICFDSLFIDEPAQSLSSLTAALRAFFYCLCLLVSDKWRDSEKVNQCQVDVNVVQQKKATLTSAINSAPKAIKRI